MNDEKAQQLAELVDYAREHFPLVAPMVNARLHHIKAKYAGLIILVGAVCELVQVVLG